MSRVDGEWKMKKRAVKKVKRKTWKYRPHLSLQGFMFNLVHDLNTTVGKHNSQGRVKIPNYSEDDS